MNDFYYHFCKVEFLCYAYKPNWLGWLVLLFGTLGILYLIIRILSSEFFQEMSESSNNSQSYFDKKHSTEEKIYKDSEGNIIEQHWFDKHLGKIIMNNLVK